MLAKSPTKNMKTREMSPAPSERRANAKSPLSSARKSRCYSPTSNASSGWDGCDYVAHAVQMTNSSSPLPPKTSANWPRAFLHRSNPAKPDKKAACALSKASLSAPATRCFSTWRSQDQPAAAPVILDTHVIEKEVEQWNILLVWMCPWRRRISAF